MITILKSFPALDTNRKKAAFKLHVGLNHDGLIPACAAITLGKDSEMAQARKCLSHRPRSARCGDSTLLLLPVPALQFRAASTYERASVRSQAVFQACTIVRPRLPARANGARIYPGPRADIEEDQIQVTSEKVQGIQIQDTSGKIQVKVQEI